MFNKATKIVRGLLAKMNTTEDKLIEALLATGEIEPLIKAMEDGTIKWRKSHLSEARSLGGRLLAVNDRYFYFYIDDVLVDSLPQLDQLAATRLECAAIRGARLGTPVSDKESVEKRTTE